MAVIRNKEPKVDCFAFNKEAHKCNALTELVCEYKNCPFYKNRSNVNLKEIETAVKGYVKGGV